ncbi:MAG: DegV family EDD domain-containing protein [Gemmatimonadota bacterium]|nr:MAG: DegV family EDD domain-containing protein [Gemmatimonadota bacterium]
MTVPVGIAYIDGPRLRVSLLAAADWIDAGREELNRINVFPVPDGDTGTNFASTFRAVAEAVRRLGPAPLPAVTKAMAEASVFSARGNSGMLLSQFLLGFREMLANNATASATEVAQAIRRGAERLHQSLDEPVEGTILTVAREAAQEAERAAVETSNFEQLMSRVLTHSEITLQRTPELLSTLKDAGVVDAGAKAFVRMLEGVVRFIEGDPILPAAGPIEYDVPDAAALAEVAAERDFQFCTQILARGDSLPSTTEIRAQLRKFGGSIVVLTTDDLLKVHIHTDTPNQVFELVAQWGDVESTKADDMRQQHRELHEARRKIAIVTDSSCDLPDTVVDQHTILIVPLQVISGTTTYLDRVDISGSELYDRMKSGDEVFTTSQPTPAALIRGFEDARSDADEVIGLFIAGALSGTLASAQTAVQASKLDGVTVVDSRAASVGLGLLVLRAAELVEEGRSVGELHQELRRVRDQSGGFFTVDVFDNLLRSGRVSKGRAWLGGLLDIKPILEVSHDGTVTPLDRVRGREHLIPRVLRHLDQRLTPRPTALRLGIAHAGADDIAERLKADLVARYAPKTCIVSPVTAAIGVHVGPGAWGIFYQIED